MRSTRILSLLYWTFCLVIAMALVFQVVWSTILLGQMPQYNGRFVVPGLSQPVKIIRDDSGVPHIFAKNASSAFFALGYANAQDRLFQMELIRRLARGQLAEILGEDLLPIDKLFRTLMIGQWAENYAQADDWQLAPESWKNLDSYIAGVNAFIDAGNLPVEYKILGVKPRPFTRADSLSALGYMSFSFAEGIRTDALYSILEKKFPQSKIPDLFIRMDRETGVSIRENQPTMPRLGQNIRDTAPGGEQHSASKETLHAEKREKNESDENENDNENVNHLTILLNSLNPILDSFPILEGSNSWILSGARTESGTPYLVNDPHIAYSNPGTWYIAHLIYGDGGRDIDVYGYFLPGVPYPLLGQTPDKAWGLTMLENDDLDLYYETLSEDGKKVLSDKQWIDLEILQEEIPVKGKPSESFTIRKTPRGPVFSDFLQGYSGRPVSIFWVFHHLPNPVLEILHGLLYARNMAETRESVALLAAPGLNFSYVDRKGDIGWWGAGRYPLRKKPTNTRKILEGSNGTDDVVGYLPFSQSPQWENPPHGIIATANNLPSDRIFPGIGKLDGNWQPSDRFLRIRDILNKKEKYNEGDMEKLLLDNYSYSALEIWEVYMNLLDWDHPQVSGLEEQRKVLLKTAMDQLSEWDFETGHESTGATIYYALTYSILRNLIVDEAGEELLRIYGSTAEPLNAFKFLIGEEEHPLWDDVRTDSIRETRVDIFHRSLVDSLEFLETRVSRSPNLWKWKNLYRVEYQHAFGRKPPLNLLFNVGPFATWGAPEVVNNVKAKLLLGDFSAQSGPSTRRIVQFRNPDENRSILPIGNSGNLASPFYRDQARDYLQGKFRRTNVTEKAIERNKVYEMELIPMN